MKSLPLYRGFFGIYRYDAESKIYSGFVVSHPITFQADTEDQIEQEFHKSVDDYWEFCQEQ